MHCVLVNVAFVIWLFFNGNKKKLWKAIHKWYCMKPYSLTSRE